MSKSQIFLLFLLSVVFGLAAVFFAKQWMDNQVQPTVEVEQVERHPVVVASQEIEAGPGGSQGTQPDQNQREASSCQV